MTRRRVAVVCALLSVLASVAVAPAQERGVESRPMVVVDSIVAVRTAIDRWAEAIRRADTGPRSILGAEVAAATRKLAEAARAQKRVPPQPQLGLLWDFQVMIEEFQPVGRNQVRARGRAFLARDSGGSAPVTLVLERRRAEWALIAHENLGAWLTAQTARFQQGRAR